MSCCNHITQSGACCLDVFVLAEALKVTNAVMLACDAPTAATQAPGLCSLPPLGLVHLSAGAIMLPNLPMPVVYPFLSPLPARLWQLFESAGTGGSWLGRLGQSRENRAAAL